MRTAITICALLASLSGCSAFSGAANVAAGAGQAALGAGQVAVGAVGAVVPGI